MSSLPYLHCRNGIYYFRRTVPAKLRPIFKQTEIIRSLQTSDIRVAIRAAVDMAHQLDHLFYKIRHGLTLLSAEEVSQVANELAKEKTESLRREVLEDFSNRTPENEEMEAFSARTFRNEVLEDLRYSRFESVKPEVDALLQENTLEVSQAIYHQLCRAALQGLAEFYRNAEIIVTGGVDDPRVTFDPDTKIPDSSCQQDEPDGGTLCLRPVINKFIREKRGTLADKQLASQSAKLQYFLDYLEDKDGVNNEARAISSITTQNVRAYKEHLQQTPSNASKVYPGMTPSQAAAAAIRDGRKPLTIETQNKYLQCLSGLYEFAINELDYEGKNPFKGRSNTKGAKTAGRDQRHPFSNQQLQRIFTSPLFTGCKSLATCHKVGHIIPRESHKYWVPLIGLYSGMREQEILQLYLEDIYRVDGIWVFDLNTNHSDKRLKTLQSKRLVPIHTDLVSLGFLDFVNLQTSTNPQGRLFPDANMASDGTYSGNFSKWFSRYISNLGIKTTKTSFHSLRHNIKDGFRNAGISDELAENFVGRSTGTTGESYGSGFSVKSFFEALHTLHFDCTKDILSNQQ